MIHHIAIGINKYKSGLPAIGSAVNDTKAWVESLKSFFQDQEIQTHLLLDEEATQNEILRLLEEMAKINETDHLIITYSGHAVMSDMDVLDSKGEHYFIIPTDGDRNYNNSITAESLHHFLQAIVAKSITLIIDSEGNKTLFELAEKESKYSIIAGADIGYRAYETQSSGVFSLCMLSLLERARSSNGNFYEEIISEINSQEVILRLNEAEKTKPYFLLREETFELFPFLDFREDLSQLAFGELKRCPPFQTKTMFRSYSKTNSWQEAELVLEMARSLMRQGQFDFALKAFDRFLAYVEDKQKNDEAFKLIYPNSLVEEVKRARASCAVEEERSAQTIKNREENIITFGLVSQEKDLRDRNREDYILISLQEHLEKPLRDLLLQGNEALRVNLGVLYHIEGNYEKAIEELSIAEDNGDKGALYPLGVALLEKKQKEEADIEEQTNDFNSMFSYGAARGVEIQDNEKDKTITWTRIVNLLDEAYQEDPCNSPALYYLGKARLGLIETESLKSVEQNYKAYLAKGADIGYEEEVQEFINSQNPDLKREAALKRGEELLQQGRYQESQKAFREALDVQEDVITYNKLGEAYTLSGDTLRATNNYLQAKTKFQGKDTDLSFAESYLKLLKDFDYLLDVMISLEKDGSSDEGEIVKQQLLEFLALQEAHFPDLGKAIKKSIEKSGIKALGEPIHFCWAIDDDGSLFKTFWEEIGALNINIVGKEEVDKAEFIISGESSAGSGNEVSTFVLTDTATNEDLFREDNLPAFVDSVSMIVRWKLIWELKNLHSNLGAKYKIEFGYLTPSNKPDTWIFKEVNAEQMIVEYGTEDLNPDDFTGTIEFCWKLEVLEPFGENQQLYAYSMLMTDHYSIEIPEDEFRQVELKGLKPGDSVALTPLGSDLEFPIGPDEAEDMDRFYLKVLLTSAEIDIDWFSRSVNASPANSNKRLNLRDFGESGDWHSISCEIIFRQKPQ